MKNWLLTFWPRAELNRLRTENGFLKERNADLGGQIDWHSKAVKVSPAELEGMRAQRESFEAMNAQQNAIAKFLRDSYADEIAAGRHSGQSLSEIVIRYLGELKALKRGAL